MKRAVWAATLTLLATGAARADVVGYGTPLCGTVGWGGWTFYTPCPQLPSPDPIYSPPDNGGNTPSIPGFGTLPDPVFPGSGGPDNFNTNTGGGNTNTGDLIPAISGGGDPPDTGGGDPPNTGSGDPPNTGSGDPPNTGDGNPPNTGGGDPPITNFVLTTDNPDGGDIPAVPEPSTMSLVVASLAGLGFMQLRKAYRR